MADREPRVVAGAVIAYRLFDVADAIDLTKAETLWSRQLRAGPSRGRLSSTSPKAVAFGVAPLDIPLAPVPLTLGDVSVQAEATARLYDFGVARLALRVPADDLSWAGFTQRFNGLHRHAGPGGSRQLWTDLLATLRQAVGDAFLRPLDPTVEEDYLIALVRRFDATMTAEELQQRIDLAPLLSGEDRPLADAAKRGLLANRFSYYADDLAALTWDRAFIYEPRGDSDVIDILDVANAQLLEMRYYNQLLDAELPRMYDLVEAMQRTRPMLSSRRFADLARRLYALVAEVTELREKVDNALQVTEDVYLARVYTAALDLFRVSSVSAAVDRKLSIIRDTYTALYEEASAGRTALMEAAILVLIAVELVLALVRHG